MLWSKWWVLLGVVAIDFGGCRLIVESLFFGVSGFLVLNLILLFGCVFAAGFACDLLVSGVCCSIDLVLGVGLRCLLVC